MNRTGSSDPSRSYREEDVFFLNGEMALAGTLCLPEVPGPYPVVVYLPGSGPATRDGLGMLPQHWETFARYGIASLAWDKPGVGASTGDWTAQTMQDRAREGLAAVRFLRERQEIMRNAIGAWGISQAGWMLPLMYALSPEEIAFLIGVSVPGGTGDEQELFRIAHQLPADGYSSAEVERALAFSQVRLYLKGQQAPFHYLASLQQLVQQEVWFPEVGEWDEKVYDFLRRPGAQVNLPPLLETIRCPVLAIFGERDTIVNGVESARVYAEALSKAENPDVTISTFPCADHALFLSETGGMKELQQSFSKPANQKVFAPGYLDLMATWVHQRFVIKRDNPVEPKKN